MIISYPVLPARQAADTEDTYLNNIVTTHVNAEAGRYPVSSLMTAQGVEHHWHGGIHLTGNEPIRAIADGTVVAYRIAAQTETYTGQGNYDTSFVLLRHETQSGANTTVVFYSLYMHLALRSTLAPDRLGQLPQWMRNASPSAGVQRPTNQRVWRKEALGFVGQMYGRATCHFEIFTTQAALNAFWRDSTLVTQGAGSADFFGDVHFVIPANQTFAQRHPRASTGATHQVNFAGNANYPLALGQAGNNSAQLFVSVRLQNGRRISTTYEAGPHNTYRQVGAPVEQDNYEYELYRLATTLYPDCPSAGYEWLRFGRILSADTTTRNENWQLVRYSPTAIGYINLAPDAIAKLSDADFVHWQGWSKRDEGAAASATDGVCDDAQVVALAQSTDADSRERLRHFICKHPSEWDDADLPTRFARFREPGQPLQAQVAWDAFAQHVQRMAFWSSTGLADRSVWHFQPLQFIHHYRKCGWLNTNELTQCIPRTVIEQTKSGGQTVYPSSAITWNTAHTRAERFVLHINNTLRKYCISNSKLRMATFFGNSIQETIYLSRTSELDGANLKYAPWYGRGLMQLTWEENFRRYGDFRGWTNQTTASFRDSVETDLSRAADSAGFYWSSCAKPLATAFSINRYADDEPALTAQNLSNVCSNYSYSARRCSGALSTIGNYYPSIEFQRAARAVNTGNPNSTGTVNGLIPRTFVFSNCLVVLTDTLTVQNNTNQRQ